MHRLLAHIIKKKKVYRGVINIIWSTSFVESQANSECQFLGQFSYSHHVTFTHPVQLYLTHRKTPGLGIQLTTHLIGNSADHCATLSNNDYAASASTAIYSEEVVNVGLFHGTAHGL